jgi:amino acid transporter
MSPTVVNVIAVAFIAVVLFVIIRPFRRYLRENLKATIVLTMAALIFIITVITIVKTYHDYQNFLANITSHQVIISTIAFALFLDFSILMIGGLFLYLANQLYTSDFIASESQRQSSRPATEQEQSQPHKS